MNKCFRYSLINSNLGMALAMTVYFIGKKNENFIFIPVSVVSFFLTAYMLCLLQNKFRIYPFFTGLATGFLSLFFTFIGLYLSFGLFGKSTFQHFGLKEILWGATMFTAFSSITLGWASIALITLSAITLFDRDKN